MGIAAIGVAILGLALGLTFRLRFLLGVVLTALVMTTIFVWSQPYGVLKSLLVIVVAQVLLQSGYFAGLVARGFFSGVQGKLSGLPGPAHLRVEPAELPNAFNGRAERPQSDAD
jgi:hypothetical protein